MIDRGDASVGLPPYNGGLFDAERMPLLAAVRLRNDDIAEVIDSLCFLRGPGDRYYINFRDLSVQQLGSIYERLLEYELAREADGGVAVRPGMFARKLSGSYYTPDDLVGLIVRETVGPLAEARRDAFREAAEAGARPAELRRLDPAGRLLELKICDPPWAPGISSSIWRTGWRTGCWWRWPRPPRLPRAMYRRWRRASRKSAAPCSQTPGPTNGMWTRRGWTTAIS